MTFNTASLRGLLPHAALAAAPIAAITFLFNAPLRADLADARARLSTLRHYLDVADPDAPSPHVLAESIRALGATAASSPVIFDAISAAARRRNVLVESINPTTPTPPQAEEPAPRAAYAFSIVINAPYENIVAFIADLESCAGFSSVRSVRIEPVRSDEPNILQAIIETDHTNYTLTTARADSEADR
ncbi:MAG: hypothetical protein AB7G17_01750 [Phycisphaerales bacterium]